MRFDGIRISTSLKLLLIRNVNDASKIIAAVVVVVVVVDGGACCSHNDVNGDDNDKGHGFCRRKLRRNEQYVNW